MDNLRGVGFPEGCDPAEIGLENQRNQIETEHDHPIQGEYPPSLHLPKNPFITFTKRMMIHAIDQCDENIAAIEASCASPAFKEMQKIMTYKSCVEELKKYLPMKEYHEHYKKNQTGK